MIYNSKKEYTARIEQLKIELWCQIAKYLVFNHLQLCKINF